MRATWLSGLVLCAALASACEPSFIDDSRPGAPGGAAGNSSGGALGSSPRWSSDHPNAAASGGAGTAAAPRTTPPSSSTAAAGTQATPWGQQQGASAVQPPGTATITQGTPSVPPAAASSCTDQAPRTLDAPGESCARPCRAAWQQCFDRCNNGQDRPCVAQCDDTYRDCMRGCY
ncbi:MAG: hypothetical protein Q8Q09_29760 [Deltaproteobacteria bacterium]|nr:hypothetical protein [Deltaproteobacteria bacterium]